jgi:hypothetical protein
MLRDCRRRECEYKLMQVFRTPVRRMKLSLFKSKNICGRNMKIKPKQKPVVRTAKEMSDESFWRAASRERDPGKSRRITELIDNAITEHEGNVRRNPC